MELENFYNKNSKQVNLVDNVNEAPLPIENDKVYNTFIEKKEASICSENYQSVVIDDKKTYWDMYKGMVFMVFSCLGFTGISFFSKVLLRMRPDITSYEVLTNRTYILFIGSSMTCFFTGTNVFSEDNIRSSKLNHIIIRSVLATLTISFLIYSIKYIDASDVYTIFYCYPAFVIVLSVFFTRDTPKIMDYLCLLCCFIGVLCVVQPAVIFGEKVLIEGHKDISKTLYFLLALCGAMTKSTEVVLVRDIMGDINWLCFPLFFAFFGLLMFPIPQIINRSFSFEYTLSEFVILVCISLSSWNYHSFLALSLKYENVSRASMINYLQIPILLITDLLMFDKKADFLSIFGSLLIFTFNFGNGY